MQLAPTCEMTLAVEATGWPSLAGKDLRVNGGLGGRGRDGHDCACEDEEGGNELHWEILGGRVGHVFGVAEEKKTVGSISMVYVLLRTAFSRLSWVKEVKGRKPDLPFLRAT